MDTLKRSEAPILVNRSLEVSLNNQNKDTPKEAIKRLKQLFLSDLKAHCPLVPEFALCTPDFKDTSTNKLTQCVFEYVRLRGHFIERTGNTGRLVDDRKTYKDSLGLSRTIGSTKWIKGSGTCGTSDLKAVIFGKFVAIEIKCKSTNDKIRPDQLKYKLSIEQSGGIYIIATTFQQFYDWFNFNFGGSK